MRRNSSACVLVAVVLMAGVTSEAYGASPKENYEHYCAQCHGSDGKGTGVNATDDLPVSPRDLTDPSDMGTFTDDQIFNTLTKGGVVNDLSPIMPPWGNTMTETEIKKLVTFIRGFCQCVFDPKLKRKESAPAGSPD